MCMGNTLSEDTNSRCFADHHKTSNFMKRKSNIANFLDGNLHQIEFYMALILGQTVYVTTRKLFLLYRSTDIKLSFHKLLKKLSELISTKKKKRSKGRTVREKDKDEMLQLLLDT